MSEQLACRDCHRVTRDDVCPECGSESLSDDWAGYVVIVEPEESEIAEKMEVKTPGRYALKVR
ncbi:MAG: transcription elongation factor subunit Spt4 [Halobacteria archaeon]